MAFPSGAATPTLSRACGALPAPVLSGIPGLDIDRAGLRDHPVVARVSFLDNAGQTYQQQGRQVAAAVALLREWTGAASVLVVGHSMGGLAARAYVQSSGYRGDVHALVTVVTPHAGSGLGELSPAQLPAACRAGMWLGGRRLDASAVQNLLPGSTELNQLNAGTGVYGSFPAAVPVHAFLSTYEETSADPGCIRAHRDVVSGWTRRLSGDLHLMAAAGFEGFTFGGGVVALHSDGVVPLVSQHPRTAGVLLDSSVQLELIRGFHSDVLDDAEPRGAVVAKILSLAQGDAPGPDRGMITPVNGRRVDEQGRFEVAAEAVELLIWDDARIDGDRVTILVNGVAVAQNLVLAREPIRIPVTLQRGDNVVIVVAENVGDISPNTAALGVDDGVTRVRTLLSRADLRTSAAFRVVVTLP